MALGPLLWTRRPEHWQFLGLQLGMGVTIILVMFGSLEAPDSALKLAVYRSMEIMVGVAVSYFVELVLTPSIHASSVSPKPSVIVGPVDERMHATAITGAMTLQAQFTMFRTVPSTVVACCPWTACPN